MDILQRMSASLARAALVTARAATVTARAATVTVAVVLLGACAGGVTDADTPIPTAAEAPPPPVPTLSEITPSDARATPAEPGLAEPDPADATPVEAPDAEAPPPEEPADPPPPVPGPTDDDPVALGRSLGVQGLADLLEADPGQAGQRGEELQRDLQRIADNPDRRRVERLQDRVQQWVEDDALDPQIAQAVQAALDQHLQDLPLGQDNEDDDDDD